MLTSEVWFEFESGGNWGPAAVFRRRYKQVCSWGPLDAAHWPAMFVQSVELGSLGGVPQPDGFSARTSLTLEDKRWVGGFFFLKKKKKKKKKKKLPVCKTCLQNIFGVRHMGAHQPRVGWLSHVSQFWADFQIKKDPGYYSVHHKFSLPPLFWASENQSQAHLKAWDLICKKSHKNAENLPKNQEFQHFCGFLALRYLS